MLVLDTDHLVEFDRGSDAGEILRQRLDSAEKVFASRAARSVPRHVKAVVSCYSPEDATPDLEFYRDAVGSFSRVLELTDKSTKEVDTEPYLWRPMFEPIRSDLTLFLPSRRTPNGTQFLGNAADLEYGYRLRSFQIFDGLVDCASLQEFYERLANVLAKRVRPQGGYAITRQSCHSDSLRDCSGCFPLSPRESGKTSRHSGCFAS